MFCRTMVYGSKKIYNVKVFIEEHKVHGFVWVLDANVDICEEFIKKVLLSVEPQKTWITTHTILLSLSCKEVYKRSQ